MAGGAARHGPACPSACLAPQCLYHPHLVPTLCTAAHPSPFKSCRLLCLLAIPALLCQCPALSTSTSCTLQPPVICPPFPARQCHRTELRKRLRHRMPHCCRYLTLEKERHLRHTSTCKVQSRNRMCAIGTTQKIGFVAALQSGGGCTRIACSWAPRSTSWGCTAGKRNGRRQIKSTEGWYCGPWGPGERKAWRAVGVVAPGLVPGSEARAKWQRE